MGRPHRVPYLRRRGLHARTSLRAGCVMSTSDRTPRPAPARASQHDRTFIGTASSGPRTEERPVAPAPVDRRTDRQRRRRGSAWLARRKRPLMFGVAVVIVLGAAFGPSGAGSYGDDAGDVAAYVLAQRHDLGMPGMAVGVVRGTQVIKAAAG